MPLHTIYILQLHQDQDIAQYPGHGYKLQFTHKLETVDPIRHHGIPIYQVLNTQGIVMDETQDPQVYYLVNGEYING